METLCPNKLLLGSSLQALLWLVEQLSRHSDKDPIGALAVMMLLLDVRSVFIRNNV